MYRKLTKEGTCFSVVVTPQKRVICTLTRGIFAMHFSACLQQKYNFQNRHNLKGIRVEFALFVTAQQDYVDQKLRKSLSHSSQKISDDYILILKSVQTTNHQRRVLISFTTQHYCFKMFNLGPMMAVSSPDLNLPLTPCNTRSYVRELCGQLVYSSRKFLAFMELMR